MYYEVWQTSDEGGGEDDKREEKREDALVHQGCESKPTGDMQKRGWAMLRAQLKVAKVRVLWKYPAWSCDNFLFSSLPSFLPYSAPIPSQSLNLFLYLAINVLLSNYRHKDNMLLSSSRVCGFLPGEKEEKGVRVF